MRARTRIAVAVSEIVLAPVAIDDVRQYAEALGDGVTFRMTTRVRELARVLKVVVYDYGADLVGSAVGQVPKK